MGYGILLNPLAQDFAKTLIWFHERVHFPENAALFPFRCPVDDLQFPRYVLPKIRAQFIDEIGTPDQNWFGKWLRRDNAPQSSVRIAHFVPEICEHINYDTVGILVSDREDRLFRRATGFDFSEKLIRLVYAFFEDSIQEQAVHQRRSFERCQRFSF